ncbi:MAG: TonB-dependent receptor, partial [Bacteroidota bacterium]
GEKRNSRVGNRHQPMAILTHDWNISPKSVLKTAVSYQAGRDGTTALDWFDARDPRPDFYRRLPSYIASTSSPTTAGQVEEILRNDPDLLQVNWDNMYEVNRHSFRTIEDADGIQGNTVSGNFSRYIVEDRRFDSKKANFYTKFQQELNQNWSLQSGLSYQWYQGRRYKVVDDLLGGDFYVNLDRFAERDFPGNDDAQQIDLNNPNQILREGDIFGYNYDADIHKAEAWLQGQFRYGPFEGFVAGDLSSTRFWLTGRFRNGKFPDDSFGEGEKQSFINYGTKAGLTYIINGRNYLFANGSYRTRAPFFRNSYVSPRTRHQLAPNLKSMSIASTEGGYILRSPDYKARIVAYYTRFEDDIRAISFYHDEQRTFVNYIVNGIDTEHKGIEVALEAKLFPGLNAKAVASIGQHQHISRPTATVSQDNTAALLEEQQTLYLNNFFVSNGPQSAYNLGLAYQPGNWWTFWVDLSYFHRSWVSPNPVRRTEAAVSLDPTGIDKVDYQSELWNDILAQEELDGFFMLDISTRKSFKWGDYYLACNLGVSNLLNNQSYITSGYEQLRFDFEGKDVNRFPARYFNGFGINYFLNLSLSF